MSEFLQAATEAAQAAGGFLRSHFGGPLNVDANEAHDIKLELDRRSQRLIESLLLGRFPGHAVLGEEGRAGDPQSPFEWIVDPIDGTVNYFYGVPHFCVSIALRRGEEILAGTVYDPMRDEIWAADAGGETTLNGRAVRVSGRTEISDAIVTVGFSKSETSIASGLPVFERLLRQVKKCRMMGSAALDLAYVSAGRLDAYVESQISIWDIAAGKLLVECAGGKIQLETHPTVPDKLSIIASSGNIDLGL